MIKYCLTFSLLLIAFAAIAQTGTVKAKADADKLSSSPYEVSGTVKDSANNVIANATVTLLSGKDTLTEVTDENGGFIFKRSPAANFYLIITHLEFVPLIKKFFYSDQQKKIVLNPFMLEKASVILNEVKITGKPTITYKNDTAEYKAKDYKVREYAAVDELLKKMEGMEVGNGGTLNYQGQQVTRAKLNGKDFAGGDVSRAIKNLPAEIVEKIQIIDNYGDNADRTGIRDGEPTKVLNITTKPDRSVGTMARFTPGIGNNDRYNAGVFAQYINANQEVGVIGNINNNQIGVAQNNIASNATQAVPTRNANVGNGGTTKTDDASFFYSDQWSKQVKVNTSYSYTNRTINAITGSYGQRLSTLGTTNFENEGTAYNNAKSHLLNLELEYAINNNDLLRISSNYNYTNSNNIANTQQLLTGLVHRQTIGIGHSSAVTPTLGGKVFFEHGFKNGARKFTLELNASRMNQQQSSGNNNTIRYYKDAGPTILKDSVQNYLINRNSTIYNYRSVATYIEPLTYNSQLQFKAEVDHKKNNSLATVDSIDNSGTFFLLSALTNNYQYSFTKSRVGVNYMIDKVKYSIYAGFAVLTSTLNGNSINLQNSVSRFSNFRIIPILRYQYKWSSTQRLTANYTGELTEPVFTQLQPFTDRTDPQNIFIGNPNLKPSFRNNITVQYNNYITNSKVNITSNIGANWYNDPVISNTVQVFQPAVNDYINITSYLNSGSRYGANGNYSISKSIHDGKYNVSLLGQVVYQRYTAMSNNIAGYNTNWRYNNRLSLQMNPTEWLEMNPYVSYDVNRTSFTLNQTNTTIKTAILTIDGRMYFLKTWLAGFSASKNYINGISASAGYEPLVINAYFEKQFLKRKNLVLNVQVFDLLHQNNYITQTTTANAIINTKTNSLSRYIMISLRLDLQKWHGAPTRNGTIMQRRGDGSFIY